MNPDNFSRVLCVDDEINVLEGLEYSLRRRFHVSKATSGREALELIGQAEPFAVVLSDMRMPGIDGATFLARVRELVPDTVRMLLTGHADLDAAISAVNQGQVFRFLTKPCPRDTLLTAFEAAAEQYRLITAEKVLLEQTLRGAVKTLTDVLSMASPAAFGRATRIRELVRKLVESMALETSWPMEVAAMLSQIACITLPTQTADKLYRGEELGPEELEMVGKLPAITEELLGNIPRLEPVLEILANQDKDYNGTGDPPNGLKAGKIPLGARMLKVVLDYDTLDARGLETSLILNTMRGRTGRYDPEILQALGELQGNNSREIEVRELSIQSLREGMVVATDVVSERSTLLVTRGNEVTPGLLAKLRNFPPGFVAEPIRVIIRNRGSTEQM